MDPSPEPDLVKLHLRVAVRMAVVLLPMMFVFGFIGGTGICLWGVNKGSAILTIGLCVVIGLWSTWAYYRTDGIMDHIGFGARSSPRGE